MRLPPATCRSTCGGRRRAISGPWVRALAAGKATIIIDLAHTADVPALDPRNWLVTHSSVDLNVMPEPVTIAIDILDEDHSLRLAMRRLATDAELRDRLGHAAADYWQQAHSTDGMIADYNRAIARALTLPAPAVDLPPPARRRLGEAPHALEPFQAAAPGLGSGVQFDHSTQRRTLRVARTRIDRGPARTIGNRQPAVAVEHNVVVIKRDVVGSTMLQDGDEVEIVNSSAADDSDFFGVWSLEFGVGVLVVGSGSWKLSQSTPCQIPSSSPARLPFAADRRYR